MTPTKDDALLETQVLLKQAKEAERSDVEQALSLATRAHALALEHHFSNALAHSELRMGRCYWIKGSFDEALTFLSQALERATTQEDTETIVESIIGLGNVYVTMEFTDAALSYYHQALKYLEETPLLEQEAKVLNNLGSLHEELKNYEEALVYYQRSRQISVETHYDYGVAIAYLNIGTIYLELKDYQLSYHHTVLAHEHAQKHQRHLLHAHCHFVLGRYHAALTQYDESIDAFRQGIVFAIKSNDFYVLVRIHLSLAGVLEARGDVFEAQKIYEGAFKLAKKMQSDEYLLKVHEALARFYDDQGLKQEAYHHFKTFMLTSEKIQENRRLERIKNIEFQTKLKDAKEESKTFRILSRQLSENFDQMQILSDIGRSMTATHDVRELFSSTYEHVNKLMRADALILSLYNSHTGNLDIELNIEDKKTLDPFVLSLDNPNSFMVKCYLTQKTLRLDDIEKDHSHYVQKVFFSRGSPMSSAIYVPLMFENQALGVLSVQSVYSHAYQEIQQLLLETLASYLAIALNNARQMEELAALNLKFKKLSERDGLTGVANRRMFDAEFSRLWSYALTHRKRLSMLFIDIDDFKEFNDSHGHLKGDDALISVARRLEMKLPKESFIARFGGDEFVVLTLDDTIEQATQRAQELKETFYDSHGDTLPVTISVGVSVIEPQVLLSKEVFLNYVDTLLYQSKKRGKNTVTAKVFNKS